MRYLLHPRLLRHCQMTCPGRLLCISWLVGVAGLCLLTTPVSGQPVEADTQAMQTVHVAGPQVAKELMEALVVEFNRGQNATTLDYQRSEAPKSAAGALAAGRDMSLSLGAISEQDVRTFSNKWEALAPKQHVIGVRAVAMIVHPRNPMDSLTVDQLQAIFSGKVAQWRVLGGAGGSIRRYGLYPMDPLASMFHDKILAASRCAMILRKKNSEDVLAAVKTDPEAIGYVDAVVAASAGDAVKVLAIGQSTTTTVLPNAQTLKDGSYFMAEQLLLYVPSQSSELAQQLIQMILTGKGDAICRRYGFLPALREVKADAMDAFEKLYRADIQRVQATAEATDDVELAHQMVQSARIMSSNPQLLAAMCDKAYELAFAAGRNGITTCFESIRVVTQYVPEKHWDCALKRAALYERAFAINQSRLEGEHLITSLMFAADLCTSARRYVEAAEAWQKAIKVAEQLSSPKANVLVERQAAFAARVQSVEQANQLTSELRSGSSNTQLRQKMLLHQLVEMNDPTEASRYLDAAHAETLKTNIPMAAGAVDDLSDEAALRLAEWYASLMDRASVGGSELMAARSRTYYHRFFVMHASYDDALAIRASLGIRRVGGQVPVIDTSLDQTPAKAKKPEVQDVLLPGEQMTDLKLAEFAAANPDITRISRREIGSFEHVTDLDPLKRLKQLNYLDLYQIGKIKDISLLSELPNLQSLTMTGLVLEDLSPLSRLFRLRSLSLLGAQHVSDLAPLSRLANLTALNLAGCTSITDIMPLKGLATNLTTLNLSGCAKIQSVQMLEDFHKLKTLDLRKVPIKAQAMDQLQRQLTNCRILE